uniref:hypothetical protein n=1 Tax=Ruminococcus sp. TaxID=41978 RepID=UPI003AB61CEC
VQIIKYSEPRQTIHVYPGTIAAITGGGIGAGYIIKNRPSSWPVVGAAGAGLLGEAANLLDMATPKYPIDTEVLINITGSVDGAVTYDYSGLFYHTAYDKRVLYPHAERDSQRRAVHHSFHCGDIILLWRTDGKKIWR